MNPYILKITNNELRDFTPGADKKYGELVDDKL